MPTIPMFIPPPPDAQEAWHQVHAPGGYEWWRFHAEDPSRQLRMVCGLRLGDLADLRYLQRHRRFLRRPTVRRPVWPRDCCRVSLRIYHRGKLLGRMDESFRPQDLRASFDPPATAIGPHGWQRQGGHCVLLQINPNASTGARAPRLTARFTPRWEADLSPIVLPLSASSQPRHWLVPAGAACSVSATFALGEGAQPTHVNGDGSFIYLFGTEHPACHLRRWTLLQQVQEDRAVLIQILQARGGRAPEALTSEFTRSGTVTSRSDVTFADGTIKLGGGLVLRRPRMLSGERSGALSDVLCAPVGAADATAWFGQCYEPALLDPFRRLRLSGGLGILSGDGSAA